MEFLPVQESRIVTAGGAPIRLRRSNIGGGQNLKEKDRYRP